ncbi:MAG: hypothetical protein ABEI78_02130, partial [Candidatus Nanohaloarchaea archaeon]
ATITVKTVDKANGADKQNESLLIQIPNIIEDQPIQEDGDIFNPIPYHRDYFIENPSNITFKDVRIKHAEIVNDLIKGSTILTNEDGAQVQHTVNKKDNTLRFTLDKLSAGSSKTFTLNYNIFAPDINKTVFTTIQGAKQVKHVQYNITPAGESRPTNLDAYRNINEPDEVTQVKLFLNGTEITSQAKYNFIFVDTNGDGLEDRVEWTVPSIDGRYNYELKIFQGKPIKIQRENVITNKPVTETKQIQWRTGIRFWNRNDFPVDISYKARIPITSSNIRLSGNTVELRVDNQGAYIPITFTISSNTNQTKYIEYQTQTVTITTTEYKPENIFLDKPTTQKINVTVINPLKQKVKNVQPRIQILEAQNLKTKYLNDTVIDKQQLVQGTYNFTLSNVKPNTEKTVTVSYNIPVGNTTFLGSQNISEGVTLSTWRVISNTPVTRQNVLFVVENVTCVEAQRAFIIETNKTLEIQCYNKNAAITFQSIGPNERFKVGLTHKKYSVVVNKIIVLWNAFANNALIASMIVLGTLGLGYVYENTLKQGSAEQP